MEQLTPMTDEQFVNTLNPENKSTDQIAEEVLEQQLKALENVNSADRAAAVFFTAYPKYKELLSDLSNKDLRKLADALIGYPLSVETTPNFTNEKAKQAFYLGTKLFLTKNIMMTYSELDSMIDKEEANGGVVKTEEPEVQTEFVFEQEKEEEQNG